MNEAPHRPTRVRFHILMAVCALALIAYIHRVGFATIGKELQKAPINLSDPELANLMFAFLLAYGAFEVPWGLLGDRLGGRHLFAFMTLGWTLVTAAVSLVFLVPGATKPEAHWALLYFLLVIRFVFGLFQAGIFPAISRTLTDWMPIQERATAQGFVWTCSRLGGAAAPLLLVPLIQVFNGWEVPWALVAGLGIAWVCACWLWMRNRPEEMQRVNAAELELITRGRTAPAGHGHAPWTRLFSSLSVWSLCLMYGFGGFSATFFITLLPAYLRKHRGLTDTENAWVSGVPLACGVAACVGGGLLSDWIIRTTGNRKWGRRLNGMVGAVGAGLALLSTAWVQDIRLLGLLLAVTFFFNDLAMGPAWAACADIGGRFAGTVGGAMNMFGNLGAALGVQVAGNLFGKEFLLRLGSDGSIQEIGIHGNTLAFVIFACAFWSASLCWLGVNVNKPLEIGRE